MSSEAKRHFLRHSLATVAYRGGKAIRGVPETFPAFQAGASTRTPVQILAHVGDLLDWALTIAKGESRWHNSAPLRWSDEISRFFQALTAFDDFLAGHDPLRASPERLFQGPIADALTHVGQIAILRRLAEIPIKGEDYSAATIEVGRIGPQQSPAKFEFD